MVANTSQSQPAATTPTSFQLNFSRLWDIFIRPAETLKGNDRRRAATLAAVLLAFIPLAVFAIGIVPVSNWLAGKPYTISTGLVIAVILLVIAYFVSRTPRFVWAAWFTVAVPYVAVLGVGLGRATPITEATQMYLALGIILTSLLFSATETIIAGIAAVLSLAAIGIPFTTPPYSFMIVTTGLTALVSRIRDQFIETLRVTQLQLEQEYHISEAAREKAERSDQVKSAFLASMSHELRTPLNSIINFTKFVAKGTVGPVNEEQAGMLGEVIDSAKHLLNLINDVLDMSKIESGSLKLFVESNVDIQAALNTVVSTGKSLLLDKTVAIETAIDPALPLITADRQRIYQVLLNIMSNACKFTPAGTITVAARPEGSDILISITDTGPGIAADDQSAVFESFKQTTAGLRQGGGTGLGMPIARNLTEAHGGQLWLESTLGQGTTFFVRLPIKSSILTPINTSNEAAK